MQRKGIATQLLERVCKDAAADGFDFAEAYVSQNDMDREEEFRGPLSLYKKCGFDIYAGRDDKVVVRNALSS